MAQRLVWVLAFVAGSAHLAFAQDGGNVLVVANTASAASASIAARYMRARAVPAEHLVRLTTSTSEEIDRALYEQQIERPIADWITSRAAQDRILYIVLTKGVPLRIRGTTGRQGTVASVDSELTLLYRRLVGVRVPAIGPVGNPYFLGDLPLDRMRPFSHAEHDIYLVSRLDGFVEADVIGLIDRGASPARNGTIVLDAMGPKADSVADGWLRATAAALGSAGYQGTVELDTRREGVRNRKTVLGYASWGSNDASLRARRLGLGFAPGALATLLVSTDARTVKEPPAAWQPGADADRAAFFEGSPQSLAADLIRDGVTGVAGYVAEPFLDGTLRPDVLFPAYVSGANLIESFYLAMPALGWQAIVFGDPLCAPFRSRTVSPEESRPALDPDTELPIHFSRRRVDHLTSTGLPAAAVTLMLKGEARYRSGDAVGARRALEEATALESRLTAAHRTLAQSYEALGEHGLAIERYRRVLADAPEDVLSLNNLAYALAVHGDGAREALDLARKAQALSKGSVPSITDTLGWIHYLLGEHGEAEKYLAQAAAAAPDNAEIQLHLAHVYVAQGRRALAVRAVARVLQLDATLAERAEVKALQARLATLR